MSGIYELYNCPYYWGEMKRTEAEALFDKKPDGSFLIFYNSDIGKFELLLKHRGDFLLTNPPNGKKLTLLLEKIILAYSGGSLIEHPLMRNRVFSLKEISRAAIRKTGITFENEKVCLQYILSEK